MAFKYIKVKRGAAADLPVLLEGEFGFTTDTYQLYIGSSAGNKLIQVGAADHGALSGLTDDDHAQYVLVSGTRAFTGTIGGVTPTSASHLATKGYIDTISGTLQTDIDTKSDTVHTHVETDVVDLDKYTQAEVDALITASSGTTTHSDLTQLEYSASGHTGFASTASLTTTSGDLQTNIDAKPDTFLELTDTPGAYDEDKYLQSTAAGTQWTTVSAGGSDNHSELNELDYASAGHTGFASTAYVDGEIASVSGTQQNTSTVTLDVYNTISGVNDLTISGTLYAQENIDILGGITSTDYVDFDTTVTGIADKEGRIKWNSTDSTMDIHTGLGPVIQVGHEEVSRVYNATGQTIPNGTPVHTTHPTPGVTEGLPNVQPCIANDHWGVTGNIVVTTHDIANNSSGLATKRGHVRDMDTSSLDIGQIWISPTVSGGYVQTRPEFPEYEISVGAVVVKDATAGELVIAITGDPHDTVENFWNGVFRESFDFRITSDGSTVTGTLTATDTNEDMTMMLSDGYSLMTLPATVQLTAGTADNPQTNYVYVPKSTKVLTASTSAWGDTEHIRVAQIALRTAALTQTDGALRNQNWNDHLEGTDGQGHLSHIASAIREKIGATWRSGVEGSCTISGAETPDGVYVAATGGVIQQMHPQTFPAIDTAAGGDIHIVNHPSTPYVTVSNLNGQLSDANGDSLNNSSFSFVMWGIGNKTDETSHLMLNLPTGSYSFVAPANAVSDASNRSVYSIPTQFQGVGFLIARFTFTYFNDDWVLYDTEDLRGKIPNTTAGGGAGGTGVTTFLGLSDTPSSYSSQGSRFVKVASGETALEFVAADYYTESEVDTISGSLNDKIHWTQNGTDLYYTAGDVGIGTSTPSEALHITSATSFHPVVEIENTSASNDEPSIKFNKNSASPAAWDGLGTINFYGDNSAAASTKYGYISCLSANVTDGTEAGRMYFYTTIGGASESMLIMGGASDGAAEGYAEFNPGTEDIDFIVNAEGKASALRVDGLTGNTTLEDDILTVSGTYSGKTMNVTVDDASTTFGDVLYITSGFTYGHAKGDSTSTMPVRAIALESGQGSKTVLLEGQISKSDWDWSTGSVYPSTTASGEMVQTVSTTTGHQIQSLGYALSADTIYFRADDTIVEV